LLQAQQVLFSFFFWIVPAALSIVTLQGYDSVAFRPNILSCLLYAPTIERVQLYFAFFSTFSFVIGAVLLIVLYSWLFHKARPLRSSEYQVGKFATRTLRISLNAEDARERMSREKKALLTFEIIFMAFCLTGVLSYLFQMTRWFNADAWGVVFHSGFILVLRNSIYLPQLYTHFQ